MKKDAKGGIVAREIELRSGYLLTVEYPEDFMILCKDDRLFLERIASVLDEEEETIAAETKE